MPNMKYNPVLKKDLDLTNANVAANTASLADNATKLAQIVNNTIFLPQTSGDNTAYIQTAINTLSASGGGAVLLDKNHTVNGTVIIPSNVTVKAQTRTIITSTVSNSTSIFTVDANTINVGIEGITFDLNDSYARNAILVLENAVNLKIRACDFKNFKGDGTVEVIVLRLKSGVVGTIKDLSFSNIKGLGNSVIGDGAGAIRCIKTETTNVTTLKNYQLNIDNIYVEECYSIDSNGNLIIEDSDPFHFQHTLVDGFININNVSAKNISKRLFKFQAKGVNVTNVSVNSIYEIDYLFGIMADNINISNAILSGQIKNVIEMTDANNINCNSINVTSTYRGSGSTDALVAIYNSNNVTLKGLTLNGNGGFLLYGNSLQNINIENVYGTMYDKLLYMEDRNLAGTGYSNGIIRNVTFKNVYVTIPSTTRNGALLEIRKNTTNIFERVKFSNVRLEVNPIYLFGTVSFRDVEVTLEDFTIVDTSSLTNPELISLINTTKAHFIRSGNMGNPTTKAISVYNTATLILNRCTFTASLVSGTGGKVELEKSTPTFTYNSSATSAQVTTVY